MSATTSHAPYPPRPTAPPALPPPSGLLAQGARPAETGAPAETLPAGERAIEVAALLGDSVVAVEHLTDPRSGKVTRLTLALFASGAALLLLSLVAFHRGVTVAAENHRAYERWVEVDGGSPQDFRGRRLGAIWDVLALVGLGGGLATLLYGYARLAGERRSPSFRIGRARGVELPLDGAPAEAFPLVAPDGDDWVFSWAPGMRGELTHEGRRTPLAELPTTSVIPPGARFRVELGPATFLVSSVPRPRRQETGFLASLDGRSLGFLAGSALVHLAFLALLFAIPPEHHSLALDSLGENTRLTQVSVKPPEDPKQQADDAARGKDEPAGGSGQKQAGAEGKMGSKESTRAAGRYAIEKTAEVAPRLAREEVAALARTAGVLGALRAQRGGTFASITGTGDFTTGLDDRDVHGGLVGGEVGAMAGGWGHGVAGTGPGGGGTGLGTVGLGRYGTIGQGDGTGPGYTIGGGKGGMRRRSPTGPVVDVGTATSVGDLDRNIIRRYIRQKLPQVQHCYEKQLVVKQALAGTVTAQFVINGNGAVISARAGGMGDRAVEECVAAAIQAIQFPRPTGGGVVNVTYPFTFRAAGE